MSLKLPDFGNPHFFWMTVCGHFRSSKAKKLAGEKIAATFATSRGKGLIRLILDVNSHLHFDLYAPELTAERKEKKIRLSSVEKMAEHHFGKEMDVCLLGGFKVQFDQLPISGMIRSMAVETKTGPISVKVNGGNLAITGAPIQRLSWNLSEENVAITLQSDLEKVKVSENYLLEVATTLEKAFNVFVLGKAPNEPK